MSLAFALCLVGQVFALEIVYAPPVVFAGEPLAFRLQSAATGPVTVSTNGVQTARWVLPERQIAEHTFRPAGEMRLVFAQGETERVFQMVRPDSGMKLSSRDGYLEADGVPAVLLPEHRKPPPLDRRWETLALLSRQVRDRRPSLESPLWMAPGRAEPDTALAAKLSGSPPVVFRLASPEPAWFEVHALITAPDLPSARFVVVEVSEQDLERGMPPHEWFMKWQFALQKLHEGTGYGSGLLLGPPASPVSAPWLPLLRAELQTLALSHRLHFVDRSQPEALWTERLLDRLSREYLLP